MKYCVGRIGFKSVDACDPLREKWGSDASKTPELLTWIPPWKTHKPGSKYWIFSETKKTEKKLCTNSHRKNLLMLVSDFGDPLHLCKVKEANVRHKLPRLDEKVVPSLMSVKWSLKKASKSSQSVIKIRDRELNEKTIESCHSTGWSSHATSRSKSKDAKEEEWNQHYLSTL